MIGESRQPPRQNCGELVAARNPDATRPLGLGRSVKRTPPRFFDSRAEPLPLLPRPRLRDCVARQRQEASAQRRLPEQPWRDRRSDVRDAWFANSQAAGRRQVDGLGSTRGEALKGHVTPRRRYSWARCQAMSVESSRTWTTIPLRRTEWSCPVDFAPYQSPDSCGNRLLQDLPSITLQCFKPTPRLSDPQQARPTRRPAPARSPWLRRVNHLPYAPTT